MANNMKQCPHCGGSMPENMDICPTCNKSTFVAGCKPNQKSSIIILAVLGIVAVVMIILLALGVFKGTGVDDALGWNESGSSDTNISIPEANSLEDDISAAVSAALGG